MGLRAVENVALMAQEKKKHRHLCKDVKLM